MNWIKPSRPSQTISINDPENNEVSTSIFKSKVQGYSLQNQKGSSMIVEPNTKEIQKIRFSKSQLIQNVKFQKKCKNKPLNQVQLEKKLKTKISVSQQKENEEDFHNFFSQISIHKQFQWKTDMAFIRQNQIQLPMKTINIQDISKIKVLEDQSLQHFRKIKITMNYQETYFALECKPMRKESLKPSLQYQWFAKIINLKLQSMNLGLKSSIKKKEERIQKSFQAQKQSKRGLITGKILKKSQFLGRWQERYVVISESGLYSFKQTGNYETMDLSKYSFSIKKSSVKYIWTRFQLVNNFLIVKVKHGMEQTQFAIPVMNYSITQDQKSQNWLYAFYRLMMDKHLIMHSSGSKLSKQTTTSIQNQEDIIRV